MRKIISQESGERQHELKKERKQKNTEITWITFTDYRKLVLLPSSHSPWENVLTNTEQYYRIFVICAWSNRPNRIITDENSPPAHNSKRTEPSDMNSIKIEKSVRMTANLSKPKYMVHSTANSSSAAPINPHCTHSCTINTHCIANEILIKLENPIHTIPILN